METLTPDILAIICKIGNTELLSYLHFTGRIIPVDIIDTAAKYGSTKVIRWALEHGYLVSEQTCRIALEAKHYETYEWLRDINSPCDDYECELIEAGYITLT
jgi:hypothetical protein